jgi:hypothetical protein
MRKLIYISLVLLLLTGCGGNAQLGGKVSFSDNEPLTVGTIYFTNDHFTARAHIRPNGTYDVGSLSERDGLPPGTYKVHISGAIVEKDGKETSLISAEFASSKTTPLSITVPGERVYSVIVERPRPTSP